MTIARLTFAMLFAAVLAASGCHKGDVCSDCGKTQAECRAAKPGTITTANKVCVVENDDPVDPSVKGVEWRGQKYGLCCEGCRKKWNAMTDAQKDEAVTRAIAISK